MKRDPPVLELSASTCDALLPRSLVSAWQWLEVEGRLEDGQPLNLRDYPWFRAVAQAWDDPRVRTISIQGAAQIGKTVLCRNLLAMAAATSASNLMYATATAELARTTVRKKLYPTLNEIPATRPGLPRRELWASLGPVDVGRSTIHVAWSGSPAKLGDVTIRAAHHGELDKWSKNTSSEADPEALADDRVAAVPDHKIMKESTPSIAGGSRINRRLVAGSNGRWRIPCPRCGEYAELELGDGSAGGLKWDKPPEGAARDVRLAEASARYVCPLCKKDWRDAERMPAIRAGVYCPEGCDVASSGRLTGEPLRPWPHWSIQISRLYSPAASWGQIARTYLEALVNPELLRDFINSTLGQVWSPRPRIAAWESVAERVCGDHEIGHAPAGCVFAAAGVDVQIDHVVFMVIGWGQQQRGWVLDYGVAAGWDELAGVLRRTYPLAGGGGQLPIGLALVDSRYEQVEDEVVKFCQGANRRGRWVWPSQGVRAGTMSGRSFRRRELDEGARVGRTRRSRRRMADFYVVSVNTNYWQAYADRVLYEAHAGDAGSLTFPRAAASDQDLFEQLTNELPEPGKSGQAVWKQIDASTPVDLRDCLRYSRCAAEVYTLGAWQRLHARRPLVAAATAKPAAAAKPAGGWFRKSPRRRAARRK